MKKLNYTLVGEGIAEYAFIPAYIEEIAKVKNIQAVRSTLQIPTSSNPSVSKVLTHLQDFCVQSLVQNNEQLFIAGIDLDKTDFTDEQELYKLRMSELTGKLGSIYSKYRHRIILYVPVQCIDHWLYYQHYKASKSKKPSANSLESRTSKEVKRQLYGDKIDRRKIQTSIEKILSTCDFEELAKQSKSFRYFHKQVTGFINEY